MFQLLHRAALVMLAVAATGKLVAAQGDGASRDSISRTAGQLLNDGRANEARILLLRALRTTTDPVQQARYRIEIGKVLLFDGQYQEASRTFNAVLSKDDLPSDAIRDAHHGLALVDAFNGRSARAATHYAQALKGGSLRDTIEMLVMTNQHDSAMTALDRLAASGEGQQSMQYVQAFRGLSWMMAGHCTQALPEIAKAPLQERPIPLAVRGRCASKHGQRQEALTLKDAVLKQRVPDPFSWTAFIARDAARRIQ